MLCLLLLISFVHGDILEHSSFYELRFTYELESVVWVNCRKDHFRDPILVAVQTFKQLFFGHVVWVNQVQVMARLIDSLSLLTVFLFKLGLGLGLGDSRLGVGQSDFIFDARRLNLFYFSLFVFDSGAECTHHNEAIVNCDALSIPQNMVTVECHRWFCDFFAYVIPPVITFFRKLVARK